jgi:hypothetical protein
MREIPLTKGRITIVDDEDYDYLIQWRWCYSIRGYAMRRSSKKGTRTHFIMHRVILDTPTGMLTDHINGNKLDNRRCNLRICTGSQNNMNSRLSTRNTTGFKGIYFDKQRCRWRATVRANKNIYRIGYYKQKEDAVEAYESKAKELFGEFYRAKGYNE